MSKWINAISAVAGGLLSSIALGEPQLSVNGFISQGFVASHNTKLFDNNSDNSWELTEAAAKFALQTNAPLRFSAQLLYRNAGSHQPESVRIDHALLDYNAISNDTYSAGIRIGRIKPQIGFYNATRDMPWTRPSIFLSQSIYPEILRDVYLSADGFNVYQQWQFANSSLLIDLAYGKPDTSDQIAQNYWGEDATGDLDPDAGSNISVRYQWNNQWQLGWTWVDSFFDYKADPNASITSGTLDYRMNLFSLQYDTERWELTAEYLLGDAEDKGHWPVEVGDNPFAQPFLPASSKAEELSYSLQARYRLDPRWTLTLRHDRQYRDKTDRNGKDYATQSQQLAQLSALVNPGTNTLVAQPAHSAYGKAWTLGTEWQPRKNWLLRVEGTWGEGLAWVPVIFETGEREVDEKYWAIYAAQVSYRF